MADELRAYNPSLRDRIAWAIAGGAGKLGSDKYHQQAIADKVRSLVDFVPFVGDAAGADDTYRALKAGNYGQAALDAGTTAVGLVPGGGDLTAAAIKAMFLGIGAKTADRAALKKAEELAASGASRDAIWNETGWFKGPDDKWRFESDDTPSAWTGPTTVHDEPVQRVYANPELYEAYPEIGMIPHEQRFAASMPDNTKALYATNGTQEGLFSASGQKDDLYRSQMGHELQHAVQAREGFARGGLPRQFEDTAHWQKMYDNAWTVRNRMDHLGETAQQAAEYIGQSVEIDPQSLAYLAEKYTASDLSRLMKQNDPYEHYRRLAGEVEARNVQKRMDMTPDQRRAVPPWETQDVPFEQQIVRFR